MIQRIALGVEYDGANYSGWQRQTHKSSVQAQLERALSKVASHPINVYCAGRTDAGVHASGQVVHFESHAERSEIAWIRGANTFLPKDIRVQWQKNVAMEFDARKSALARRYAYVIFNHPISPAIMHKSMTWVYAKLDVSAMQSGANYLLGQHDFSSFRAAHCQAKTPIRTIHAVEIKHFKDKIILDITANAFLHHMVRNIVGTLLMVGQQKLPPSWIGEVLAAKDRRAAGVTASPHGLYLMKVIYPNSFQLPNESVPLPWFYL